MNKKIIILIIPLFIGGISFFLTTRYRSKKQESLEVKEKSKSEEKEEKKVKSEERQQKEDEEIFVPWLLTRKGEGISLLISIVIYNFSKFFFGKNIEKTKSNHPGPPDSSFNYIKNLTTNLLSLSVALIFEILSPFLFAFEKFKKEKYHQRLKRTFSNSKKIIIITIVVLLFMNLYNFFYKINKSAREISLLFFASAFKCCKRKQKDTWRTIPRIQQINTINQNQN